MAKQNRGLGRGLDSLLGSMSGETSPQNDSQPISDPVSQKPEVVPVKDKKLPVKQAVSDQKLEETLEITEDNVSIKGVVEREAKVAPVKEKNTASKSVNAPVPMDEPIEAGNETDQVSIDKIEPNANQPRTNFKQDELDELAESIKNNGLLQPIVVRKIDDKYQIIAGERRWQACKIAGIEKVPIRILEADEDEALMLALIENIQRSDLNPIEEAYGYRRLMDRGHLTQTQVAQAVSKGRSTIANALRLLELPEEAQKLLYEDKITAGHARAILSIPTRENKEKLTEKIVDQKLTVREAESLARLYSGKAEKKNAPRKQTPKSYKTVGRSLESKLKTDVRIRNSRGRNTVEIYFKDESDLQRICHILLDD